MKLIVEKNKLNCDYEYFLRRKFSYVLINNRHTGRDSFVRKLTGNRYPRFHMYVSENSYGLIFDLHLDQKEPSYGGQHAHSAEYDSEVVKAEIERLKEAVGIIGKDAEGKESTETLLEKAEEKIGQGSYDKEAKVEKKKGFFSRLFS